MIYPLVSDLADEGIPVAVSYTHLFKPALTRSDVVFLTTSVDLMGRLSNPVQRRLSADKIDELARLYREGATIDALARRYAVHRTTVIHHLDQRGVPRRRVVRKMTDSMVAAASKRYATGVSLVDLSLIHIC